MMRHSFKREMGEPWRSNSPRFVTIRRTRARFFRRVAFTAFAALWFSVAGMSITIWTIAHRFGVQPKSPILVLVVLFCAVAVMILIFGGMRKFATPLEAVMDAADRVAEGDYTVRVPSWGPLPMRALAHSFNTMTERLQNADRLRRNIMADVAHELRTPLTVLQGRLEGLIDGVYPRDDRQLAELLEETRVLSRLIEDLRTLALSDAGALPLQRESTDVVELVRDVVGSMTPEADKQSVSLSANSSVETARVDVDPVRIREVLTNILSNAVRHSASGASVTVFVDDTEDGVAIVVRDAGEGMSSEELARIFDRFYKGSASRGSGLGLAIAKSIVTAHGGEIRASSERGKGTIVEFTLPR
jgi:signal transduction histidine kinase